MKREPLPDQAPSSEGPVAVTDVQAIYTAHFTYVWHSLRRLGIPEKDLPDVTHDVFLTVARALSGYDRTRALKPWLFGVAFRVASDHLRLHRHAREVLALGEADRPDILPDMVPDIVPGMVPDMAPSPEQALLDQEARALVVACLAELEVSQRAVLILFDIEGQDARQIALALDIPCKTVYSRLRAARLGFSAAAARRTKRGTP
jgi:RNA polymerase sigma-70 factor (ECF subfamily)